jgi:phosphotransferase family enzyme
LSRSACPTCGSRAFPGGYDRLLDEHPGLSDDERRRLIGERDRGAELCAELAGFGLSETIEHDDFHDGQVFVCDGRYLLMDWGDACVAHPFFSLAVTLDGVLGWGPEDIQGSLDTAPYHEAYLQPFAERTLQDDLARAATIARRLGWVCRAVNCHLAGAEPATTLPQLRMFLGGQP